MKPNKHFVIAPFWALVAWAPLADAEERTPHETRSGALEFYPSQQRTTSIPVAMSRALRLDAGAEARTVSYDQDTTEDPPPAAYVDEEINTGQDPTRPLTRLDLRYRYQELPGGFSNHRVTFRVDKPIPLNDGWALSLRFDAPLAYNNVPSRDNPNGDYEFGFSDSLMQALLITPPFGDDRRWAAGVGMQVLFPTGSQDQFGTGKWQLAPTAAVRAALPEISPGSFAALLVRHQFSFAGKSDRRDIQEFVLQPVFNWQLPDFWFVTLAPEIRFDLENDGDAFVPFDILVGKMLNPRTVASIQFAAPIVDDYKQFDWQVEFRIGFFF